MSDGGGVEEERVLARRVRGSMLWFNEAKGHGYISTDAGERLYVDGDGFGDAPPEGPCAGMVVELDIVEGAGGKRARDARLVDVLVPRRARRRGHH